MSCLQILHLSILFFATVSRKVKSPSVTSLLMAPSTVHMHQTLQSTMGEIDCKLKLTSVVYYKFCVFLEKLYETLGSDKYILLSYRSMLYIILLYTYNLHIVNKLFDIKMNCDSQVEVELDNISYQLLAEMTYVRPFFFNFTVVYILRRTFSTRNSTLGIIL